MIELRDLKYGVGAFSLEVSLDVGNGEYFVLLGNSGSGKTMLLESICGLRQLSCGSVMMDGRDITFTAPGRRGIGYVPQDCALFNHLVVRENIGFALRIMRWPAARVARTVEAAAEKLGIAHLLGRNVYDLSGGERQRVAVARAIVVEPSVLLFDEPVSALDSYNRNSVCDTLAGIRKELGIPVIHVCHSFEEARRVSTRIGIMKDGRIIQCGASRDLLNAPESEYAARILGLENIFRCILRGDGAGGVIDFDACEAPASSSESGRAANVFLRPWALKVLRDTGKPGGGAGWLRGRLESVEETQWGVTLRVGGVLPIVACAGYGEFKASGISNGDTVKVLAGRDAVCLLRD